MWSIHRYKHDQLVIMIFAALHSPSISWSHHLLIPINTPPTISETLERVTDGPELRLSTSFLWQYKIWCFCQVSIPLNRKKSFIRCSRDLQEIVLRNVRHENNRIGNDSRMEIDSRHWSQNYWNRVQTWSILYSLLDACWKCEVMTGLAFSKWSFVLQKRYVLDIGLSLDSLLSLSDRGENSGGAEAFICTFQQVCLLNEIIGCG